MSKFLQEGVCVTTARHLHPFYSDKISQNFRCNRLSNLLALTFHWFVLKASIIFLLVAVAQSLSNHRNTITGFPTAWKIMELEKRQKSWKNHEISKYLHVYGKIMEKNFAAPRIPSNTNTLFRLL